MKILVPHLLEPIHKPLLTSIIASIMQGLPIDFYAVGVAGRGRKRNSGIQLKVG